MPPFNVTNFLNMYPQFVGVFSDPQIEGIYDNEALVTGSKLLALFRDTNKQFYYAQLVLAHILTKYQLGLTGIIASASEGSVSGNFDNNDSNDARWWNCTTFGQTCWKIIQNRGGATLFGTRPCAFGATSPWYPF